MFEQTFVERRKTKKTWTVLVSFLAQIALYHRRGHHPDDLLRCPSEDAVDQFPGGAAAPAPSSSSSRCRAAVKIVKVIPRQFDAGKLMAPKSVPKEIAMIKEEELPPPRAVWVV